MDLPDIAVSRRDLGRLDAVIGSAVFARTGRVAAFLLDEITRARIIRDDEIPPTLITMGAAVQFRDKRSGRKSVVRLVYPNEATLCGHDVSVLTPVGAALLGLFEGQSIDYEMLDGRLKTLTVIKVVNSSSDDPMLRIAEADREHQARPPEPRRLWFT